jgi:hypothetical protein
MWREIVTFFGERIANLGSYLGQKSGRAGDIR